VTIRPRQLDVQTTLIAASLLLGAVGSGLTALTPYRKGHDFDLVAAAHPATPRASETDSTAVFVRARAKQVKADASATASASCDSCSGRATALQVIYLDKARIATTENTATAWSSCRNCGATSTSVQVVVMRPGTNLTTRNRSLAVNTSCKGCDTTAIAVQFVVVTKDRRVLSSQAREQLKTLASQVGAQVRRTALVEGPRTAIAKSQAHVPGVDELISAELRPLSVQRHLDVHVG
jgi:hypothetical protein